MRDRRHLIWFITVPVMATLVAAWALTLRTRISRTLRADPALQGIFSSFSGAATDAVADLRAMERTLEESVASFSAAIEAQALEEATIEVMRTKLEAATLAPAPTRPDPSEASD